MTTGLASMNKFRGAHRIVRSATQRQKMQICRYMEHFGAPAIESALPVCLPLLHTTTNIDARPTIIINGRGLMLCWIRVVAARHWLAYPRTTLGPSVYEPCQESSHHRGTRSKAQDSGQSSSHGPAQRGTSTESRMVHGIENLAYRGSLARN